MLKQVPRCKECNRKLKDYESVLRGYGSTCWSRLKGGTAGVIRIPLGTKMRFKREHEMSSVADMPLFAHTEDVILRRIGRRVATNVPHKVIYHSPDGYEFGYAGSGSADLAINILMHYGLEFEDAFAIHHEFMLVFVATVPRNGGAILATKIREWIRNNRAKEVQRAAHDVSD